MECLFLFFAIMAMFMLVSIGKAAHEGSLSAVYVLGFLYMAAGYAAFAAMGRDILYKSNRTLVDSLMIGGGLGLAVMFAALIPMGIILMLLGASSFGPKRHHVATARDQFGNKVRFYQKFQTAEDRQQQNDFKVGSEGALNYIVWLVPFGAIYTGVMYLTETRVLGEITDLPTILYAATTFILFSLVEVPRTRSRR